MQANPPLLWLGRKLPPYIYHTGMIKPDDTVVDLGAGIGDFAIKAMRRAKNVIAVEPNQQDFELLLRNLRPMAVIM
jgi:predicted RNA methylase